MLTETEFAFVAREVKTRSGAVLTRDMAPHAEQRLQPLSRREGFSSVAEMLNAAKIRSDGKLWDAIADALAQTETRFFRDKSVFDRLRTKILPALHARNGAPLKVWCAGCSTGQEAYSLAMQIEELRAEGLPAADILATDMSERLLDKARAGLYTQFEVQRGLPIRKFIVHFEKVGDLWRISDRLRASVRFERHNLLEHPAALGRFDLVLCRNVVRSFDAATRLASVERLADALEPHGVLLLGADEPLPDGADSFRAEGGVFVRGHGARQAA